MAKKSTKNENGQFRSLLMEKRANKSIDFSIERALTGGEWNNEMKITMFSDKTVTSFNVLRELNTAFPSKELLSKYWRHSFTTNESGSLLVKVKKPHQTIYLHIETDDIKGEAISLLASAFAASKYGEVHYKNKDYEPYVKLISSGTLAVNFLELQKSKKENGVDEALAFWVGCNNKIEEMFLTSSERLGIISSKSYQKGLIISGAITPWIATQLILSNIKPAQYSAAVVKSLFGIVVNKETDDISFMIEDLKMQFELEREKLLTKINQ